MNAIVMPAESFAELAFELRVYARRECASNLDVEVFLASQPGGPTPDHRRLVADLQASAERIGRAAMLLSLLAPHEAAVRALVRAEAPAEPTGERHACLAGS